MLETKLIKNTTTVPDKQVNWLIGFCVKYVNKVKPSDATAHYNVVVNATNRGYKGIHWQGKRLIQLWIQWGSGGGEHNYYKFKDMPRFTTTDSVEDFVYVMAHELAHHWYSGRREGEFKCELMGQDAVVAFRKVRAKFDKLVFKPKGQKPTLTKDQKAKIKIQREYQKKMRWVKTYCKKNNITHNLFWGTWDNEVSFTLQGRGRVFEGMGDYMYTVGGLDAYERLKDSPITTKL